MIKLKIIAFFLSLLMVVQMLPISQIGQMLSTNQWTEELPHNATDQGGKAEDSLHPTLFPPEINHNIAVIAESKTLAYLHSSDQIPSNHSTDVVCPPPDTLA
ncbi:MAG: hypothetical protein ABI707_03325 [Ferruginibacter sp.]